MRPELKQIAELTAADFQRHPVWIGCHTADHDQEWYDETDEETFRPWTGSEPLDPAKGMFLVRARATFADGSVHDAFLTPARDETELGTIQPNVFVGDGSFGFWWGMLEPTPAHRRAFYLTVGREAPQVFPARFLVAAGALVSMQPVEVKGFYWMRSGRVDVTM
jgi:hypothetical protein